MPAKVLVVDVETQRGIVESFNLWPKYIPIDRVIRPTRLLCFAGKFTDESRMRFHPAWDDDDDDAYRRMVQAAWDLLNEADVVVGWNNKRFDDQQFNAAFEKCGFGPVTPYKSMDLFQVARSKFSAGEMSLKLDWFSRMYLGDRKTNHGATDLWHDIRYGTRAERRAAQKIMREYNIHDVELTEQLFHRIKPWSNINFALYERLQDGLLHCTRCNSTNLKRDGKKFHHTSAQIYQMWRCKEPGCGATSRGAKTVGTTALRPV